MKENTFFKLFIIFFIGLTLRLWCIDKAEGLWNDEYVGWYIASINDVGEFVKTALQNCHTPLYYLYLKFWMFILPDTDLNLRWSSVLPSILSIIGMYFLGKELLNKKVGLLCALFTAISSFCIYFAQEVRLYSLLFFITTLTLIYFIKSAKEQSMKNLIIYFCSNGILCATHTLGIIFSFFNIFCLLNYINKNVNKLDREKIINLAKYITPLILILILISPFLITISTSKNLSQFWSEFSITKIICTFVDYYSPIQTNIQNTFNTFIEYLFINGKFSYSFLIFGVIPTLLGIIISLKSVFEKNKILNYIALSGLLFFLTIVILSILGKMIIITKYTIEIYPILLLMLSVGFINIRKEKLRYILLLIFVGINTFYLLMSEDSASKRNRPEGHKAVVQLIEDSELKENDYIVFTYYNREKFDRYLSPNMKFNFLSINKFDFNYFLFDGEDYFETLKTGKQRHKDFFREFPNKKLEIYAHNNFLSKMKKGDRVGIVVLKNVSFLGNNTIHNIIQNKERYDETSIIFLVFSAIKNNFVEILSRELTRETTTHMGDWTLYVFVKEN